MVLTVIGPIGVRVRANGEVPAIGPPLCTSAVGEKLIVRFRRYVLPPSRHAVYTLLKMRTSGRTRDRTREVELAPRNCRVRRRRGGCLLEDTLITVDPWKTHRGRHTAEDTLWLTRCGRRAVVDALWKTRCGRRADPGSRHGVSRRRRNPPRCQPASTNYLP